MNIVIVGSGYVGLVTGACLAEKGQHVTCVDISESRIEGLKRGVVPIYEPGLDEIIDRNAKVGRLEFTTSLPDAMKKAQVYCIAVGTPPDEDGSADLSHVLAVAREIGQHMTERSVIINKSTVPVGTADRVRAAVDAELARRGGADRIRRGVQPRIPEGRCGHQGLHGTGPHRAGGGIWPCPPGDG